MGLVQFREHRAALVNDVAQGVEKSSSLLAFGGIVLEELLHTLLGLLFVALLRIGCLDRRLAAPNKRFVFLPPPC